ncbi:MAG: M48 family metalloprotease, partial [Bdellovibrionales bacterium]|nr:M48 family metalloprotease [Bdellovibrionales bacterium]
LLNGDIRINLQLIAALAGITVIGQTGKFLMQQSMGSYSRSAKQSSFFRRSGRGGIGLALFGVLLWLIGCIGLWVGRLIKAAISRQREFLADASAVQFTRSTEGLAGALFKIGLLPGHAILKTTPHAEELNHLCFGESIPLYKEGWMASHPPIEKRIEALSPGLLTRLKARHKSGKLSLLADRLHSNTTPETATGFVGPETGSSPLTHAPNSAQIGAPTPTQMNYAQQLLAAIPQYVRESLNDPEQAKTCLNLLIHLNQSNAQLAETRDKKESLLAHWITQSPPTLRFPLVELATPALKTLSKSEKADFLKQVLVEVKSDGNISRLEFALLCFLDKHLMKQTSSIKQITSLAKVKLELNQVLAYLAGSAHASISGQQQLLGLAHRRLWGSGQAHTEIVKHNVPPPLGELHRSIKKLAGLTPLLKQPVLEVFEDLVREDGLVRPEEYEALRMLSEVLDCPMPLLFGCEGAPPSTTHL